MSLEASAAALSAAGIDFSENEPLSLHTTFKIGGCCDLFVCASSVNQLISALNILREQSVPFFILGHGSNLLISDAGISGAVIFCGGLDDVTVSGSTVTCGAGVGLSALCRAALENSLKGTEFAYGIPGTVGGALFMNAGAYGGQMADIVADAEYIDRDGCLKKISVSEMRLGYRNSVFRENGGIITSVRFELESGDKSQIENTMRELMERRRSKQPLEFPSAGSTFKRPEGNFAGTLIEKCGLKGLRVGGASVSEKHAGFIINDGGASAHDVKCLIEAVQKRVFESSGVMLEPEVIIVGKEGE